MPLGMTSVRNLVRSILGASTTYGTNDDTLRHPDSEIDDAILDADQEIALDILESPNNPFKTGFYTNSGNLASGAKLPASDGPYGAVLVDSIVPRPVPAPEVARLTANTLGIPAQCMGKVYAIEGNYIFHNGTNATIEVATITRGASPVSPEVYAWAVVAGALAILFAKDAADTETAQYFATEYMKRRLMIRQGTITALPAVTAFQKGMTSGS